MALERDYAEAYYNRGGVLKELKRLEEAIESYDKALAIKPGYTEAYTNRGNALQELRRLEDALTSFSKAVAIKPNYAEAHYNCGNVLRELKRFEDALASYDKAVALKLDYAEAYTNRGITLQELKRFEEAITSYDKALAIRPNHAEAYANRGNTLRLFKRFEDALANYGKALALRPDSFEVYVNCGLLLQEVKRFDDALASYDKALALRPDSVEVYFNRGRLFHDAKRFEDALASYDQVLALKPDYAEAYSSRGDTLKALDRFEDAVASYDKALATAPEHAEPRADEISTAIQQTPSVKPKLKYTEGARLFTKMQICDWRRLDAERSHLVTSVREGAIAAPFSMLALSASPSDQLKCAQSCIADSSTPSPMPMWQGERYVHDKIRIAYISSDFRDHAVSYLIAGLFEQHDRSQFEPIAISLSYDEQSIMRTRIKSAFELFIDLVGRSSFDVARMLHDFEADIVIDLMAHTGVGGTGILVHRPAPVQVNYLGFSGTTGADYVDYIVADRVVIPEDQQQFYTENVVYLPDTYMCNDARRRISDLTPTRDEAGLPETGFVFCAFNNSYKITPDFFAVWMRLLRNVENSVLWLSAMNDSAKNNLRREAELRGVRADRLIFAPRMTLLEDHLARHRLADFLLDTLPVNAQTTASDSLWAGLPVLTCLGSTFCGRVAGSLLNAVGLPELITHSLEEYEAMALKLAEDPFLLASLKAKLARNRDSYPLFNTEQFTRHIEAAYKFMWERYQREEPAIDFAVKPIG